MNLHGRFLDGLALASLGLGVALIDLIKAGTVLLGFCGALLACLGGWQAWRSKRLEVKIKTLELKRLLRETPPDELDA